MPMKVKAKFIQHSVKLTDKSLQPKTVEDWMLNKIMMI